MTLRKRNKRSRLWASIALGLTVLGALAIAGCRSLSKSEMERRLRALEKNAPFGALLRTDVALEVNGENRTLELVYLHEPALLDGGPLDPNPVVLVHGTPSTLFSWTELIYGGESFEGLRATHDVYAIEVVGHGIAPGDAAPYGFERAARFVAAAIRALGLERVHLVGSSYGGEFVWRTALNEPDLVAGLVLLDSSGYTRRDGDWLPEEELMRASSLAKLGWMLNSRDRIRTALEPHFDTIPSGRVDEFFLVCDNAHNWKAMIDLARDENGDREDEIANIQAPTLVLWGEGDIAYPLDVYGQRFVRDIPRAELVTFPDTGHYPHEQRPTEVLAAMRRFFGSIDETP
jgi:pimeloyl-ACP methyl ester carboxylesterase